MRIIASLTTMPRRIDLLKDTLDSLRNQTCPVTCIEINVPFVCVRTGQEYVIPDWLHSYPDLTIFRTEDYGAITKVAPTLLRHRDEEDTYIWSVDDDIRYPANTLQLLMRNHEPYLKRILVLTGTRLDLYGYYAEAGGKNVMILEGFGTVLYPANCIEDDFLAYVEKTSAILDCRVSDDIVLSNYMYGRGIFIYKCDFLLHEYDIHKFLLPQTYDQDATHKQSGGHTNRYIRVLHHLKAMNELSWDINFKSLPQRLQTRAVNKHNRLPVNIQKSVTTFQPTQPTKANHIFTPSHGKRAGKRFCG